MNTTGNYYFVIERLYHKEAFPYLFEDKAEALKIIASWINEDIQEEAFDASITEEEAGHYDYFVVSFDIVK